jgi:hypothetical protein
MLLRRATNEGMPFLFRQTDVDGIDGLRENIYVIQTIE